jgi:HEAT repeat protein
LREAKALDEDPQLPRPVGIDRLETLPLDDVVDALATPHLERAALWRLVAAGAVALPYVKRGLNSSHPAVRRGCCEFLDLYPDDDAADALVALLEDSDAGVRWMAAHALTCDRCKTDNTWIKRQQRVRI